MRLLHKSKETSKSFVMIHFGSESLPRLSCSEHVGNEVERQKHS